jgi:exosortase
MLTIITWGLFASLYAPLLLRLYRSTWRQVDYTHAYVILPVALWLAWRSRFTWGPLLEDARPAPQIRHLALLAFGQLMFLFGWRFDYLSVMTLSLVPVLYGMVAFLYGADIARRLAFPIGYLLLLVPPPMGILDAVTLPMRHGASVATEAVLQLAGYPIFRHGLLLSMGEHDIFMGQPCSGFRSLITMLSLALVYVHLTGGPLRKQLVLVGSIVPLALLGNVIRIIALCLITYHAGEEAGQGFFHNVSGLVVFGVMLAGLMALERWLDRFNLPDSGYKLRTSG